MKPLGAILGRLGAKLGGLGATFGAFGMLIIFGTILGAKRVPTGRHFGSQNGAKTDQKITYASENPTVQKVTSGKKNGKIPLT